VTKGYPLEPARDEMIEMAEAAARFVADFIEALPDAPASDLEGVADAVRSVRGEVPEKPGEFAGLVDVVKLGAAKAFNTTGPGYFAYIPGGGLYAAAIADFLATSVNRFVNLWNAAPVFAALEWDVIRWLCDAFGYPEDARGILTSGGSMSNFSAIVTARTAKLSEEFLDGCLYVTEQTHLSVAKAARLAGFPARAVRIVPTDTALRMEVRALITMIQSDRVAGMRPFCVVASAGTTNTGAVDPLSEIADVCVHEDLWLHSDAAYGGFFFLTERGGALFRGIERADSITLDPHKALFLPYGTGALLIRDGALLRKAHQVGGEYLQDLADEGEIPNFTDYSAELSRDFRGLRVWLPLKLHGLAAFRDALDEKLDLARTFYEALAATPGFEVPWEPALTIVPFRYRPASGDIDAFNMRLLEKINASKRIFLSSTRLDGAFWLRVCIVSHRTHEDRITEAIEIIREAARALDG
jgi:aromatic-L-amino-acid decarboxylase